jgi:hypothetical protein
VRKGSGGSAGVDVDGSGWLGEYGTGESEEQDSPTKSL